MYLWPANEVVGPKWPQVPWAQALVEGVVVEVSQFYTTTSTKVNAKATTKDVVAA